MVSGCLCKKCRQQKIVDSKTKYNPGDIITSKTDKKFLFIRETEPQIGRVKTVRCGIFIALDDNNKPVRKEFYSQLGHIVSGDCTGENTRKSNAEINFASCLDSLEIKYETEKTYEGLLSKNGGFLRFDFLLHLNNKQDILIELDGEQHYKPCEKFGGEESFQKLKENDSLKNEYCEQHNIPLIRIPY